MMCPKCGGWSVTHVKHGEDGCGLVNRIRIHEPHTHHYCDRCHNEWVS
jgi:hypothetical protein